MKKLKDLFFNINKLDLKIMKNGLLFSLAIAILGTLLLFINIISLHTFVLFYIGLSIIKLSFYFAVEFVVCGIVVDKILFDNV